MLSTYVILFLVENGKDFRLWLHLLQCRLYLAAIFCKNVQRWEPGFSLKVANSQFFKFIFRKMHAKSHFLTKDLLETKRTKVCVFKNFINENFRKQFYLPLTEINNNRHQTDVAENFFYNSTLSCIWPASAAYIVLCKLQCNGRTHPTGTSS